MGAARQPTDLVAAVGGPWGMVESAVPAVAFVIAYSASGSDTRTAAVVAVSLAGVFALARLVRRESPLRALSGLVGVAFAAFIAARSGKAENFFLPGLLLNAAYAAAMVISIAVRRPLVGVLIGRRDRATTRATWLWAGLFSVRLAVQLPLFLAGAVVALGVARTAMGLPLFALGLWLTFLMVRQRAATDAAH